MRPCSMCCIPGASPSRADSQSCITRGGPVAEFQLPPQNGRIVVRPWLDESESSNSNLTESPMGTILKAAQRSDEPVIQIGVGSVRRRTKAGAGEYALGIACGCAPSDSAIQCSGSRFAHAIGIELHRSANTPWCRRLLGDLPDSQRLPSPSLSLYFCC